MDLSMCCLLFVHLQWWIHFSLAVNDHELSFHALHLFLLFHD
jgi:hypothetical protein